jgi:hypothetical protein
MDRSDLALIGHVAYGPKAGPALARPLLSVSVTPFQQEERLRHVTGQHTYQPVPMLKAADFPQVEPLSGGLQSLR